MRNNFTIQNNRLFIGGISAEELVHEYGSSLYVYDAAIIRRQYAALRDTITYPRVRFHYACKANSNIELLKILKSLGSSIETVSIGEVELALEAGFAPEDIIYTCGNISIEEQKEIMGKNITMNLDSLTQVRRWGEIKPHSAISIRINQGIGAGYHHHWITGGPQSKFGIDISQLDEVRNIAEKYNLRIVGLHQHIGSGILDETIFLRAMDALLTTATQFSDLEFLDFGGGFGITYTPEETPLNMQSLGNKITEKLSSFMKTYQKELLVRFEPGRFLVAESGVLLATVMEIKRNPEKIFVGINSGFNQLIRPAMYGVYQKIVNANSVNGEKEIVSVVGNICESADFFTKDREITTFSEGDIVAILDSGAYGYSMSSQFNARTQPLEILVENGTARLIRNENGLNNKKKLLI